jgi:hypothetical protein
MPEDLPNAGKKDSTPQESKREGTAGEVNQPQPTSTNPSGTDHAALDLPSDFPNSQPATMEVYHKPELHHGKKQWKEYFLEFLMIFLAVTLGFFAENLREYISDRGHVRQLGNQLIHDLKNDSAILDDHISRDEQLVQKSDSLFSMLQSPISKIDAKKLQELIISCYNVNLFQPSSGAIAAIKNELHLKQFAKSNITVYISNYETAQDLLKTVEQFHMANLREYMQGFITVHFTAANAYSAFKTGTIVNGELRNVTQNDLDQLSVEVVFIKNYNELLVDKSKQMRDKAAEFIQYVATEFE